MRFITTLFLVVTVLFFSCEDRESTNPHDSKTDPDFWNPSKLTIEQLEVRKVRLTWKDNAKGEDGYRIDRKIGNGEWNSSVGEVTEDVIEWIDTNHSFNEVITYRVYGFAGKNNSSSITGTITPTIPPPSNLKIVQNPITLLTLTWKDNSIGEDGFKIDRKIEDGDWEVGIGTTSTNTETWSDSIDVSKIIKAEMKFYYKVYTFVNGTETLPSGSSEKTEVSITPTSPRFPSMINIVSVEYDKDLMTVQWEPLTDSDSLSYDLVYSQESDGDKEILVENLSKSSTSHSINDFDPTHENWFWIKITDLWGRELYGNGMSNTVHQEPNPVGVLSVDYDTTEMEITWEEYQSGQNQFGRVNRSNKRLEGKRISSKRRNNNEYFVSYELLYSESEGGVRISITTINDVNSVSYSTSDFDPNHENWFWIKVNDYWGLSSIGDGMTNTLNVPPTQIDIRTVEYDTTIMIVYWYESPDEDFSSYELLHSYSELEDKTSLTVITDKTTLSHTLTEYDLRNENWFWIRVSDYWDKSTVGNGYEVINEPPQSIDVLSVTYDINEMIITWSQSSNYDFGKYELLKSDSETGEKNVVTTVSNKTDTSYVLTEFDLSNEIWFWIKVIDLWDLSTTGSGYQVVNEVPQSVDVTSISYDVNQMTVSWLESPDKDFSSYEVLYSTTETGDKSSLTTISDKSTTSYSLTEFDPLHENWFWIKVTDHWGQTTIGSGMTNEVDTPPETPTLLVNYSGGSFHTSWTENSEDDFNSYNLYEATSNDMNDESVIYTTYIYTDNEYTVSGIGSNELRYYRVETKDVWGLTTSSDIVLGDNYDKITYITRSSVVTEVDTFFQMDIDGSNKIQLFTIGNVSGEGYEISSDGTKMVFQVSTGIYVYDFLTKTTTKSTSQGYSPSFSPDGMKIVYSYPASSSLSQIYVMNVDGTNVYQLTDNNYGNRHPQYSPEGKKIVYQSEISVIDQVPVVEIYLMDTDGSNQTKLTDNGAYNSQPKFSPDGSRLIFMSYIHNAPWKIWSMTVDGSNLVDLSQDTGINNGLHGFDISPDGNKVVYCSEISEDREIYIVDIDGTNLTRLTNNIGGDQFPEFSPHGTKIVYQSEYNSVQWDVFIMDVDGSNKTNLTNTSNVDNNPKFRSIE